MQLEGEKWGKYSVDMQASTENGVSGNKGEMVGNNMKRRERNDSQTNT